MSVFPILAHEGLPLAAHDLWRAWSWEPAVVIGLLLLGALYGRGDLRFRSRERPKVGWRPGRRAAFWAGWAVLAAALVSPLHAAGGVLFSAHMVQHQLLMAVAAPLLVLGRPLLLGLWALPPRARRAVGRLTRLGVVRRLWGGLARTGAAWTVQAIALLAWHLPALYQRTLTSDLVHAAQHASLLGSAVLFWWSLLAPSRGRAGYGTGVLALFATTVYTGGLGALLTLAPRPWYPAYAATTPAWGLTPLEDQQLAGLIMWVPGALAYLVAAVALGLAWLAESERRVLRWEALRAAGPALLLALGLLSGCERRTALSPEQAAALTGGDPERGRVALRRYGCGACHAVPGVPGADALVGPPLAGLGGRAYVAGVLSNTPENLAYWIRHPQRVDPRTAMPELGVSAADARDIASYLYTVE